MKKPKKKEEKYPIKISDWIVFLENESHLNIQIIFLFSTVTIAALIGIVQFNVGPIATIIAGITLYILFMYYFSSIKIKSKPVQLLLDDIIEGKINNPKKIRKRWINDVKPKQRKLHERL